MVKKLAKVLMIVVTLAVAASALSACANNGQKVSDAKKTSVQRKSWDK